MFSLKKIAIVSVEIHSYALGEKVKTFKDVFIKIDDKSIKDFISKVTDATKTTGVEHMKVRKTQNI